MRSAHNMASAYVVYAASVIHRQPALCALANSASNVSTSDVPLLCCWKQFAMCALLQGLHHRLHSLKFGNLSQSGVKVAHGCVTRMA